MQYLSISRIACSTSDDNELPLALIAVTTIIYSTAAITPHSNAVAPDSSSQSPSSMMRLMSLLLKFGNSFLCNASTILAGYELVKIYNYTYTNVILLVFPRKLADRFPECACCQRQMLAGEVGVLHPRAYHATSLCLIRPARRRARARAANRLRHSTITEKAIAK